MKRLVAVPLILLALLWLVLVAADSGDDGDTYRVRAYFDNGSFAVSGQDVRVAGANVGVIEEVGVSGVDERVSKKPGKEVKPGTAMLVLKIEDPGYQDFREDASCILRPQSLIGERFVECKTTEPRADSEEAPPPLEVLGEDEPGAGQRFLPLENNGRTVDIDLVNNVYREPFRDRFRLILNELGAGFATRGDDLAEIVERANPAMREGNKVLEKLADQRKTLAHLTRDSDRILKPLVGARDDLTGFIKNVGDPAEVTASRQAELEEALSRLPGFLREMRSTMEEFDQFTTAAAPVLDDLGVAAPDLARGTAALEPFSSGATRALRSLGNAGEKAGPLFIEAEPTLRKSFKVAEGGVSPTKNLNRLLSSTRETNGFEWLMELIYNTGASVNGFDEYGTYLRTYLLPINCVDYADTADFNCNASFRDVDFFRASKRTKVADAVLREMGLAEPRQDDPGSEQDSGDGDADAAPNAGDADEGETPEPPAADGEAQTSSPGAKELLNYLVKP